MNKTLARIAEILSQTRLPDLDQDMDPADAFLGAISAVEAAIRQAAKEAEMDDVQRMVLEAHEGKLPGNAVDEFLAEKHETHEA